MKTNKFSRVIALLLSLVMLLGTLPTSYAEGSTIVENAAYEAALDAIVQMYHDELAAITTYEEAKVLYGNRNWNHFEEFFNRLPEDERTALDTQLYALYEDFVTRTDVYYPVRPVDFTGVAGFMPAVSGSATYNLRTASIEPLADDETSDPDPDGNGVVLDKYISSADATNGEYTLTLEAYTTGAKTKTETQVEKPVDIILVLDQSGSMAYCINCGATSFVAGEPCDDDAEYTPVYSNELDTSKVYYRRTQNGNYRPLYYCAGYNRPNSYNDCTAGWYSEEHYGTDMNNHDGDRYTPKTSENDYNNQRTQFYTRTASESSTVHQSRRDALETTVEGFVASVAEKAAGTDKNIATTADNVNHRIAVVGFASQSGYGNNTEILSVAGNNSGNVGVAYNSLTTAHYQAALQSMDTTAGVTMVNNAVNALAQQGATQSDLGMAMATNILANNPLGEGEQRSRIVIMFTDGTPTSSNTFDETVANGAISQANTQKNDYGATVYTIGVFDGADASNPTVLPSYTATNNNQENRYMHLVSSNYPEAENMNTPNDINPKVSNSKSYYLSASNTTALNTIFEKIAGDVEEAGGSSTTLTEETVVKDIVASQFVLPEGSDPDQIKVYTADYVAANTFEEAVDDGDGVAEDGERVAFDAEIGINGSTISVSNFNFSENWVGTETTTDVNGNTTTTYRGKKLIIEVPIAVREDFLGGYQVETNGKVSGIFENEDATERLEEFVSPKVDVPLKTITPVINDQHVYLSNHADLLEMITHYTTSDGETTAFHQYTYEVNGTKKTATIDGINNSHVDITYTFADMAGNVVATYTVEKGKTTGTFTVVDANKVLLTDSKQYQISCTVTPNPAGTLEATTGKATGWVHIYKPVLTFQDTEEKYQSDIDHTNDTYYPAENYVSNVWQRNDGTASTAVTMSGSEPGMHLTYAPDNTLLDANGVVISKTDVSVNVSVELEGDDDDEDYADYTAYSTSIRLACDCPKSDATCDHDTKTTFAAMGNDPEFIVHIYDVYGSLKLSKEVVDNDTSDNMTPASGQEFTFTVTLTDASGTPLTDTFSYTGSKSGTIAHNGTITLTAGQSVTISELPPETKYTVTEAALVGYTSAMVVVNDNTLAGQIDAGKTDELKFTNTYKVGDLKITKVIENADGNTADDVFTFSVNIGGATQTVTITGAGSKTIEDILIGTSYSVQEVTNSLPKGYEFKSISANSSGSIAEGVTEITVTNTYKTGDLEISKTVEGTYAPDDAFTFTVNLPDGTYTVEDHATITSLTVSGGAATVSLKHGEKVTITGIPAGATYTVTETADADYTTDPITLKHEGTIVANDTQIAAFKNVYQYQQLTINKEVKDSTFTTGAKTFNFTITDADGNQTQKSITITAPATTGSVFETLPVGTYTVTETTVEGYATTYWVGSDSNTTGAVVELPVGQDRSVTVVNTANSKYASIPVTKIWDDNNDALDERPSSIDVKLNATVDGTAVALAPTWMETSSDTWTGSWTNVDKFDSNGNLIDYRVTETAVPKYTTDPIQGNPNDGYTIINRIAVGDLEITKQVKDSTFVPDKTFTFTVIGEDYSETVSVTVDADKNGSYTISNLPIGNYTVTETAVNGYATTMNGADSLSATVTVPAGSTVTVEAINTANSNREIEITKIWDDESDELKLRPADIAVTLSGDGVDYTSFTWDKTTTANQWATSIEVPMFTDEGEEITYSVTETQVVNYNAPVITGNAANGFTITNSIAVGDLEISKTVEDEDTTDTVEPDENQTFTFTVVLKDKNGNSLKDVAYTGDATGTISDGGTITLKHGESVTIENLPDGSTYTVTETVPTGYTVDASEKSGTIAAGATQNAAFVNTFKVADLTIDKTITGGDSNTGDDVFTFIVQVAGQNVTTYYVGDEAKTATDGKVQITESQTAVIRDLPIGTAYTVTETDLPTGYTEGTKTNASGTIPEGGITATVNNIYATHGLTISKMVETADATKLNDTFEFTVSLPDGAYAMSGVDGMSELTVTGGSAVITLKHGQTAVITGIPDGAAYTVKETADPDYTTVVSKNGETAAAQAQAGTSGTIDVDGETVAYTNTYNYGSLTISKSGLDLTLDPDAKTLYQVTGDGVNMTVVVEGNGSVTIERLPLGTYTVTELTNWSWRYETTSANPQQGTITKDANAEVSFVNKRETTQWLDGEHSAENQFKAVTK